MQIRTKMSKYSAVCLGKNPLTSDSCHMKPEGQGNNPLRIDQSDFRISRMEFSHWLERRNKHEVMRAINSWASNDSNALSSKKQTIIHKIELRFFERAPGKNFSWFCRVSSKNCTMHFNMWQEVILTLLKHVLQLLKSVSHYLMSVALTGIENVDFVRQCLIETNLSLAECVTKSNHAHVLSQYWFLCEIRLRKVCIFVVKIEVID